MKRTLVGLVAVVALFGTACASDSDPADTEAGKDGAATSPEPLETTTTTEAPAPLDDQAPPPTINGLTVDGDTLWIASIEGDQVIQIDRETGAILQRFDTAGAGPDDVAVADDGTVYSTGFANGDLGRIRDGEYDVLTKMEPGINPIELSPDGDLLVGTYGPDGKLYEVPTDGGDPKEVASDLPDINAFAVLDDGTVVAPGGGITGPGLAVQIDPATGEVTTLVDDLSPVAAGASGPEGEPFLLANVSGEVYAIDVEGRSARVTTTVTAGVPFDNLAFADDGTIYLSSFTEPTITVVSPDGAATLLEVGST